MMSLTSHASNAIRHTWGSKPNPGHGPSACGLSLCCCSACQLISIQQAKSFPSDRRRRGGSPTLNSIGLEVGIPEKALRMPAWTVWKDSAPTERVGLWHTDIRFPPLPHFQITGAGRREKFDAKSCRACTVRRVLVLLTGPPAFEGLLLVCERHRGSLRLGNMDLHHFFLKLVQNEAGLPPALISSAN